jgi:hypothetical protein
MNSLGVRRSKQFPIFSPAALISGLGRRICQMALLALAPVLAWSQIALVNVTTCAQTFPAACTIPATGQGNLIVVGFTTNVSNTTTTIISITDNSGNTYAEAGAARAIDSSVLDVLDIWYAKNSASGATSVTVTPSASVDSSVVIWEFSGVDRTAPLDQTAVLNSQPPSTTVSGAAVTLSAAPEVIISIANVSNSVTGIASGNSFTNDSNAFASGWAHLITSTPGTYAPQWTQNPAGTYDSSTVSFRAASSSVTSSSGTTGGGGTTASLLGCDVNKDGLTNVVDVQVATNNYLSCSSTAFQSYRSQVISGVLGSCSTATGLHTISLSWPAVTTGTFTYNVYRSTTSGSYNYSAPLNSAPISGTSFVDCTVSLGQTYYYVVRTIDSSGNQSASSNEVVIPVPSS